MRLLLITCLFSAVLFAKTHENKADETIVNVDNFTRAATDIQYDELLKQTGGMNKWYHLRTPTPVESQPVIRMNRDTLYSNAIVNISEGAELTIPDSGDRYLTVMVVNQDHYINKVFDKPGTYKLTTKEFNTPIVSLHARILIDSNDQADIKKAQKIQDALKVSANSNKAFTHPDYDQASFKQTDSALKQLGQTISVSRDTFGKKSEVNPVHHLIGTAIGWGGLPAEEASYESITPNLPVGEYQITVKDVPVKAFWSVTVYNKDGFFEKNSLNTYNINSVSSKKNEDGSTTVHLGGCQDGRVNCIPLTEGWNYTVRMYKPEKEILDGKWTFPKVEPVKSELAE